MAPKSLSPNRITRIRPAGLGCIFPSLFDRIRRYIDLGCPVDRFQAWCRRITGVHSVGNHYRPNRACCVGYVGENQGKSQGVRCRGRGQTFGVGVQCAGNFIRGKKSLPTFTGEHECSIKVLYSSCVIVGEMPGIISRSLALAEKYHICTLAPALDN